jgi:hypothetical protein
MPQPSYVFPGLWPFIERVAKGREIHHLGRARDVWHCKQIQDSLGQLPRLDPESRRQLLGHVFKLRASLAVAIEGIDAAVAEVSTELDLVSPDGGPRDAVSRAEGRRKKETRPAS